MLKLKKEGIHMFHITLINYADERDTVEVFTPTMSDAMEIIAQIKTELCKAHERTTEQLVVEVNCSKPHWHHEFLELKVGRWTYEYCLTVAEIMVLTPAEYADGNGDHIYNPYDEEV